ncbi:hypothetical protein STRDD11_00292 [Streptococcus sp. DD11]|nr:hypothetical protein STRDD11_00292 [Streptococcus sp. DD11]
MARLAIFYRFFLSESAVQGRRGVRRQTLLIYPEFFPALRLISVLIEYEQ